MDISSGEMAAKAADLFQICDQEDKGFVTKRDMQRMRKEFPLDPEQLESAFDALDIDGNGYLTLEEFTAGFANFLGIDLPNSDEPAVEQGSETLENEEDEDDDQFEMLLDELGIRSVMGSDNEALKSMWNALKLDPNPEMMANFEEVLSKLTGDVQKKSVEQENLETTIRQRTSQQQEQINKLYEEMEQQLAKERSELRAEEERKEKKLQQEYESLLQIKDQQLQTLLEEKQRLQKNLDHVISSVPEIKEEKERLAKEKEKLERDLNQQKYLARDLQDQIDTLRQQIDAERKARAKAAFRISENIAQEREDIVSQLDLLKSINTKFLDERDCRLMSSQGESRSQPFLRPEVIQVHNYPSDIEVDDDVIDLTGSGANTTVDLDLLPFPVPSNQQEKRNPKRVPKQTSVDRISLLDEITESVGEASDIPLWLQLPKHHPSEEPREDLSSFEDYESQPQYIPTRVRSYPLKRSKARRKSEPPLAYTSSIVIYTSQRDDSSASRLDEGSITKEDHGASSLCDTTSLCDDTTTDNSDTTSSVERYHKGKEGDHGRHSASRRGTSDYDANSLKTTSSHNKESKGIPFTSVDLYQPVQQPSRIFKVIFIGDSSVGKTSLITRFCKGQYNHSGTSSTVGINFQTRTLLIDDIVICLQCWDTAGQERYRSMTRQFFRKSDAAVIVYDITNEGSFLNARQWLDCARDAIQVTCDERTSQGDFLLLGNKADLADDDIKRAVRKSTGMKLARQYSTLFGEVSAADGRNVDHCLTQLARALAERQDYNIQRTIKLSPKADTKEKCC